MAVLVRSSRFGRCVAFVSLLILLAALCQFHFWSNDDEGDAVHASVTQPALLATPYIAGVYGADVVQKSDTITEPQPNLIMDIVNGLVDSEDEASLYLKKQILYYNGGPGDSLLLREVVEEENGVSKSRKSGNAQKDHALPPTSYTPSEQFLAVLSEIPDTYLYSACSAFFGTGAPPENKAAWMKSTDYAALNLEIDFITYVAAYLPDFVGGETSIDMNGFSTDDYGNIVLEDMNGIPDLAEILIVQKCLKENLFDIRSRWESFETLFGPVNSNDNLPMYNTGLAYCCLGDFGSLWLGTLLLSRATGQPDMDYDKLLLALETTSFLLSASGDIDYDGNTALMEWEAFGAGYDFYEGGYSYYELALFDINQYAYALEDLNAITYTVSDPNVISIYPPSEYVVRGTEIIVNSYFQFDGNDFYGLEPKFDHWHITGETELSPRYSGHEPLKLTVNSDIAIELSVVVWDPATPVSFADFRLEAAVRYAINKPYDPLTLGDVCTPTFDTLWAGGRNIESLEGLENCRYLKTISLTYNEITDLSPLSTLYRLLELGYAGNYVNGLDDLADLHDLESLEVGPWIPAYISYPDLVNYNVIEDPSLLANFRNLIVLNLCETPIPVNTLTVAPRSIMALLIDEDLGVNMAPLLQMESLYLFSNANSEVTDADLLAISGISSILTLILDGNHITSMNPFAQCTGMDLLSLSRNPDFENIPDYFPNMTRFLANHCTISNLTNLKDCGEFIDVGLNGNMLTDITPLYDARYNPEYAYVYLEDNTLDHPQSCAVVSALRARGVTVYENTLTCEHTLTYHAGENGSISGPTPQEVSDGGSGLPVTAVPVEGYFFIGWSDGRTDNPRTDVNVTESIDVTATFTPGFPFELGVEAGGAVEVYSSCGTITSTVVGPGVAMWYVPIDCEITLVQYADPGYRFDGWYGTGIFDCNGEMGDVCSFIMTGAATAEAKFLKQHALTLTVVGEGALTATSVIYPDYMWTADMTNGPETITVMLDSGTPLHIVADAFPSCGFDHWAEANLAGNPSVFDLILSEDTTVTAVFNCDYELNIIIHDEGQGTVTVAENCSNLPPGEPCYDLLLHPCPAEGYRFSHWENNNHRNLGVDTPYDFTLTRDRTLHAYFEEQPILSVEITGEGLFEDTVIQLLCGHAGFDPTISPGAFRTHSVMPYTYISADRGNDEPDSELSALEATIGWRFDHWATNDFSYMLELIFSYFFPQITINWNLFGGTGLPNFIPYQAPLGQEIPYTITPTHDISINAVFVEHHLPSDLQALLDYLREEQDTLELLANDPSGGAVLAQLTALDWPEGYAAVTDAFAAMATNAPLAINTIGQFNLNVEEKGSAIPDMVEVYLVERILEDLEHPLHEVVAAAYQHNLALWIEYNHTCAATMSAFGTPPPGLIHALAAYGVLDPHTAIVSAALYAAHLVQINDDVPPTPPVPDDFMSTPELLQTADLDGDGFSNLDEWLFTDYGMGHPLDEIQDTWVEGLLRAVTLWISEPYQLPTYAPDPNDPNIPPLVSITLEAEGEGNISPFLGQLYLSKYVLTDWYAWLESGSSQDASLSCRVNMLKYVNAVPADGWVFENWDLQQGSLSSIVNANELELETGGSIGPLIVTPSFALPLTKDTVLKAKFDYRPWMLGLNLVQAHRTFLMHYGLAETDEEVLYFDRGYSTWNNSAYIQTDGNGIPDFAEMMVLEHILHNQSNTHHRPTMNRFVSQYELIMEKTGNLDQELMVAAAAYLTFNDHDYRSLISEVLDVDDLPGMTGSSLTADGDLDRYRIDMTFTNLEEWWYTLYTREDLFERGRIVELAEYYLSIVFDCAVPPYDWEPFSYDTGGVPCGVWNDDYIPKRKVKIIGDGDVTAVVIDPGGCANERIYDEMEVHLGRSIYVSYKNTSGLFSHWSAPGTLLNGSGNTSGHLVVVPPVDEDKSTDSDLVVEVVLSDVTSYTIPEDFYAVVTATSNDERVTIEGSTITGPGGAFVSLSYTVKENASLPSVPIANGWRVYIYTSSDTYYVVDTPEQELVCTISNLFRVKPYVTFYEDDYHNWTHTGSISGRGTFRVGGTPSPTDAFTALSPESFTTRILSSGLPWNRGQASVWFQPEVGWQVSHFDCNYYPYERGVEIIIGSSSWGAGQKYITDEESFNAHGTLVEMPQLTWDMKSMDGSATQAEMGYVQVSPAKAYYPAATPYNQGGFEGTGQLVKLTAETHCGYEFVRWTGKGDVYNSNGLIRTDISLSAAIENVSLWADEIDLYIKMAENNNPRWEPTDRNLTAVYRKKRKALCVEGARDWLDRLGGNPTSAAALRDLGYAVTELKEPFPDEVCTEVVHNQVFTFWGHGPEYGSGTITLRGEGDNEITQSALDLEVCCGTSSYKLVLLSSCRSGGTDYWKDAFNAESVIGWSTKVNFGRLDKWEKKFWSYVSDGRYTADAAIQAYFDTEGDFFDLRSWPFFRKEYKIQCYGSVQLTECSP